MARSTRNRRDRELLQALACGASVENAARKSGVSERTVYRRLAEPAFARQLSQLRADLVQGVVGSHQGQGRQCQVR